jgi:hypothetical protein
LPASDRPSLQTVIRGFATKFAFQTVNRDDGDNITRVKQGKFIKTGSVLNAGTKYEARDFRAGDWMGSDAGLNYWVSNDSIQGPWNVSDQSRSHELSTLYRWRDQYEVPTEGRYDFALAGQFSASFNSTNATNIDTINSYFTGGYYGDRWKLLNCHVIMLVKNYAVDPNFAIDRARELVLKMPNLYSWDVPTEQLGAGGPDTVQEVVAATVRTGHVYTLWGGSGWDIDHHLVEGDTISLVHVCFAGGSLVVGGWENSWTGTNTTAGVSFDVGYTRLTELGETVTQGGQSVTIRPQVLNEKREWTEAHGGGVIVS